MKHIILIALGCAVISCAWSQHRKPLPITHDSTSLFALRGFYAYPSGSGSAIVDSKNRFVIPFQGGTYGSGNKKIHAYIYQEEDSVQQLFWTTALLTKDTLEILITGFNGVESQQYLIRISNDKYTVGYQIRTTMDDQIELEKNIKIDRKIAPYMTKLRLSTSHFMSGTEVRGYTEFKGKCVSGCGESPFEISLRGNFSVFIE